MPPGIIQPLRSGHVAVVATGRPPRLLVVDLRSKSLAVDRQLGADVEGLAWDVQRERLYVWGPDG